jgi:hypothetical protein
VEEYDVIDNIPNMYITVDQILVEFQDRFFDNGTVISLQTVKKLKSKGYEIYPFSNSFEEVSIV